MAQSQFAVLKTELIKKCRPWTTVEQVELAILEWVGWFNYQLLHSEIGDVPPVEIEQPYYAEKDPVLATASHGKPQALNPGRFIHHRPKPQLPSQEIKTPTRAA